MDIVNLIRECVRDCSELILRKIEESDTIIDDMLLEKIKWFFNYLKIKI